MPGSGDLRPGRLVQDLVGSPADLGKAVGPAAVADAATAIVVFSSADAYRRVPCGLGSSAWSGSQRSEVLAMRVQEWVAG